MDINNEDSNDGTSLLSLMSLFFLASIYLKWVSLPMWDLLSLESVRARQGKIRCGSLQDPSNSSFWTLFNSRQDDALIALCGFNHAAFQGLLQSFQELYYSYRPVGTGGVIKKMKQRAIRKGQPRHLCATSCLALYLACFRTSFSKPILQIPSPSSTSSFAALVELLNVFRVVFPPLIVVDVLLVSLPQLPFWP